MQVRMANKDVVLSSKTVCLPLRFSDGPCINVEFRVVPRLNHPMILGMSWLASYNPQVDWTDRTVSLQCDGTDYVIQAVRAN